MTGHDAWQIESFAGQNWFSTFSAGQMSDVWLYFNAFGHLSLADAGKGGENELQDVEDQELED